MNSLRNFHNEHNSQLPPALHSAFASVQAEDDALGAIESDYERNETNLVEKEWGFAMKEEDFYKTCNRSRGRTTMNLLIQERWRLLLQSLNPSATLRQRFDHLRAVQMRILDADTGRACNPLEPYLGSPADVRLLANYGSVLMQITEHKTKLLEMREALMRLPIPAAMTLIPNCIYAAQERTTQPTEKPRSLFDGSPPDAYYGLPTVERIEEWLFGYMKENALERRRFSLTFKRR
ncbi:hypothetical protein M011DRAFT_482379 [Sporormia fimetaria CBS 119925]|uniref:Uncharacterized protein n=1 Tax=Sporormia fimetaria CBS 119925 TaxID=1340428 RepID=A0A6A6UW60_9PLEO|nr:hypothetical protein M011DRAFT_482379 [Sporormia fimetaria CBS 119925]